MCPGHFELCLQGQLCITINSMVWTRMGWAAMSNKLPGCHLAEILPEEVVRNTSFSVGIAMKYQFIHSFIHNIPVWRHFVTVSHIVTNNVTHCHRVT